MNGNDIPLYYSVYWKNCVTGVWVLQTNNIANGKTLSFMHTWSSTGIITTPNFPPGTY